MVWRKILKWQEFLDTFEASSHKNPSPQPIDEFNYLRVEPMIEALKSIARLELKPWPNPLDFSLYIA